MLKEFAFTPQVFDPVAAPNDPRWREYIRAIILAVFRVPAVPPIVISGMHWDGSDCSWEVATRTVVETIADGELRRDAQALLTQMSKHLVRRPPGQDWPGDEEPGWGLEAALAHRAEPLDRIVAQRVESIPDDVPRASLASVVASDFWNVLHLEVPQPANVSEAASPLRLILRHSDVLVLSMPYETCEEFALECVRRACARPSGAAPPTIHVHRKAPANVSAKSSWIRSKLAAVKGGATVFYYFWPDEPYRERLILGCRLADLGGGRTQPSVRWGVSLTHVWGEGDASNEAPGTQSLLRVTEAKQHLDRLQNQAAALGLVPVQV